jgi:hypothetical protein
LLGWRDDDRRAQLAGAIGIGDRCPSDSAHDQAWGHSGIRDA